MLTYLDRIQLAVHDRAKATETFRDLLGAEVSKEDGVKLLGARRTVVQAGISEFELLQPDGDGLVQQHLDQWGEGIFAAGFSSPTPSALCSRLTDHNVTWREDAHPVFIEPDQTPGLRGVPPPAPQRSSVGLISFVYEATNLIDDHEAAGAFYAESFGLDASRFSPIESGQYGYTGQLTLFDPPGRLDRIELSQITDPNGAMGRFKGKRGQSIYMCYVETPDVGAIIERLKKREARWAGRTDDPNPEGIFIHPTSLHGALMGVSRTNLAWRWSGRPELAGQPA